ncbi:MAG: hypothetical protein ABSA77_08775 [Thermoguttaceae bacterium]|jgi:hypothetical protein
MFYEAKPGRLVVCERTGRWAAALRGELSGAGLRVWETRSLTDCGTLLAESPASFAVLELSEKKIGEILDFIRNWQADFPLFCFAVVADRNLAYYKWFMHEAGAADFICSVRKIGAVARTACRHLAHAPPLPQSLTERIWANLPWGRENC